MAKATLTITRRGQSRSVELEPAGNVLGRHPQCDVILESGRVSRRHARIYQDPFGRWVVEDLGSKHGVWIRDERIEASAVLPGERLVVGPFSLTLTEETYTPQIGDRDWDDEADDRAGRELSLFETAELRWGTYDDYDGDVRLDTRGFTLRSDGLCKHLVGRRLRAGERLSRWTRMAQHLSVAWTRFEYDDRDGDLFSGDDHVQISVRF